MSLTSLLQDLATRVATESKSLRTLINGNAADLSALTTTAQTNLVAAINELDAALGAGVPTELDDLTDVVIGSPAAGHTLVYQVGTTDWRNVLGTTLWDTAGAAAAAASASQPLDSDLTAIAALTTTSYGRGFLALADAAAGRTTLGLGTAATTAASAYDVAGAAAAAQAASQPLDADLTAIAALSTSSYGRAFLVLADQVALMALLSAATETDAGVVELATTAETTTGSSTTLAVTPAGVAAAVAALVDSAPGTLDTLNELAAALGDDPNFATTIATNLSGKQPLDADLTAIAALTSAANKLPYATGSGTWALTDLTAAGRALIDDADAAAQRTTLDVFSKTEIGDVTTNFVATFEAGLV